MSLVWCPPAISAPRRSASSRASANASPSSSSMLRTRLIWTSISTATTSPPFRVPLRGCLLRFVAIRELPDRPLGAVRLVIVDAEHRLGDTEGNIVAQRHEVALIRIHNL